MAHRFICEVCKSELDDDDVGDAHVSTHVRSIRTRSGRVIDRHEIEWTHSVYSDYFGGWNGPGWYTADVTGRRYTRIENVLRDLRNAVSDVEEAMNGETLT